MKKEKKSDQNAVSELTREGLYKENKWLWEENRKMKEYNGELIENHKKDIAILCEENKKLNEFKTRREESMFYFKAQMERAEPKTASEAEDLQRAKEIFEKLYREELYSLEQENKKLREELEWYKKQYEHSMGEDEGKLVKGGYASFNEYGELMEEDTLQELRDLGKI